MSAFSASENAGTCRAVHPPVHAHRRRPLRFGTHLALLLHGVSVACTSPALCASDAAGCLWRRARSPAAAAATEKLDRAAARSTSFAASANCCPLRLRASSTSGDSRYFSSVQPTPSLPHTASSHANRLFTALRTRLLPAACPRRHAVRRIRTAGKRGRRKNRGGRQTKIWLAFTRTGLKATGFARSEDSNQSAKIQTNPTAVR